MRRLWHFYSIFAVNGETGRLIHFDRPSWGRQARLAMLDSHALRGRVAGSTRFSNNPPILPASKHDLRGQLPLRAIQNSPLPSVLPPDPTGFRVHQVCRKSPAVTGDASDTLANKATRCCAFCWWLLICVEGSEHYRLISTATPSFKSASAGTRSFLTVAD